MAQLLRLVATCPVGLEEFVARELAGLGVDRISRQRGAVTFRGDWTEVMRCNLWLRCANRVLVELAAFPARSDSELARGAAALLERGRSWARLEGEDLLHPSRSLSVRASSTRSRLRDVRWIAQRTKDGIVDAQRARFSRRSDVDRGEADTPLRVLLRDDRASILLDTSREPLDRRGYRVQSVDAPLREHLAAACVLAAGDLGEESRQGPIYDPMCGSGTLLAEAGSARLDWAPGRLRERWMFQDLPVFERSVWQEMRSRVGGSEEQSSVDLIGNDIAPTALRAARRNLVRAGFSGARLERGDAFTTDVPEGPGLLLVNPPYGERISGGADDVEAWRGLGDLLKQRFAGWRAVVLAGGPTLGKHIGLRPTRRWPVRNGPLEAKILVFDLY